MKRIGLIDPDIPETAWQLLLDVFASRQFSPGPYVRHLEEKWAALHGSKHGVMMNSGTDALRVALLATKERWNWQHGDYVAVPAVTFPATINVVLQAQLRPFFVDVGMNDYLMNADNLEWRVNTSRVKLRAVIPVHLFGQSVSPDLFGLCRLRGWKILEDSCETVLNPTRGDISCHSFYMAHHVMAGAGGIAVTNDEWLATLMRSYANHGRSTFYIPGYEKPIGLRKMVESRFVFERVGYSCRATEFQAVLAISQLAGLEGRVKKRREVAKQLRQVLGVYDRLVLPREQENVPHTWLMFPVLLKGATSEERINLCVALEEHGIETRPMFPITNQPCYRNLVQEDDFTVAKEINACGFYVPCHDGLTEDDVRFVGDAFGAALDKKPVSV